VKRPGAASRLYRLALRAFPRAHRQTYAAEMADAVEQELGERALQGRRWSTRLAVSR
jgi:hypothetical protein